MPLSSNPREYIQQGNAAPGPDGDFVAGGRVSQGSWKEYANGQWGEVGTGSKPSCPLSALSIVTWNIDGWSRSVEQRLGAILASIQRSPPDLILLQELNGRATRALLDTPWIQSNYYTTEHTPEADNSGVPIVQITLAAKTLTVGDVFSVSLPSRYERNLVCCDIRLQDQAVRIVNVHFDSLAHDPSFRPAQVKLAADLVRAAGRGVIAGDWNPVMQIDHTLVSENRLLDAWEAVRPGQDGFTWNWDGRSKEPFPPQRLDKVAVVGLKPLEIEVLEPGTLDPQDGGERVRVP